MWKRSLALVLVLALIATASPTFAQDSPDLWRRYAEHLPVGAVVRVRTVSGTKFIAALLSVDDRGITLKPNTRRPEPLRHIAFDDLAQLELKTGPRAGAKALVGIATGIGVFYAIVAALLIAYTD